jgi:hypothetical protein
VAVHQVLAVAMEREDIGERPENFLQVGDEVSDECQREIFSAACVCDCLSKGPSEGEGLPRARAGDDQALWRGRVDDRVDAAARSSVSR